MNTTASRPSRRELQALRDAWAARWPEALTIWSKFTRLTEPRWSFSDAAARREGLTQSFAMIRFADQAVILNLPLILRFGVEGFPLEVMAHEIGHHVYCPGDLTDHARMIARMRPALPTKEHLVGFIANLYADLLINDRLQRSAGLSMAGIFRRLAGDSTDRMWTLYMRIYEILWSMPRGELARGAIEAQLEGDAQLGARLIRSYARDWLGGAGRFASLCLPYLIQDDGQEMQALMQGWRDTEDAAGAQAPDGLTEVEPGEREGNLHPALDPELAGLGLDPESDTRGPKARNRASATRGASGQHREPFEYGEILKALGMKLSDHDIAMRYYRERALPHLVRFPTRLVPESTEPLPEGLEPWDIGAPFEDADWLQSILVSPHIVPGMTTVQRVWGTTEGATPQREPVDLDLYVDSSGSMPDPQFEVSYLTLAGAIITLSALRAGARVQATLWSGAGQFEKTRGFSRDEQRILRILTGFIGGGTAFPIHVLRDTYAARKPTDRPAHILVISDNGVTTMFETDERGANGWEIAQVALARARGGGTLALNIGATWKRYPELARADGAGWKVQRVQTWADLVAFARAFSATTYGNG